MTLTWKKFLILEKFCNPFFTTCVRRKTKDTMSVTIHWFKRTNFRIFKQSNNFQKVLNDKSSCIRKLVCMHAKYTIIIWYLILRFANDNVRQSNQMCFTQYVIQLSPTGLTHDFLLLGDSTSQFIHLILLFYICMCVKQHFHSNYNSLNITTLTFKQTLVVALTQSLIYDNFLKLQFIV